MAIADQIPESDVAPGGPPVPAKMTSVRRRELNVLIFTLAAASICFRALDAGGLRHTAAVFIGLPTLMALAIVRSDNPTTGTGVVMRVITLALLLSSIVFAEALVCIAFAAPIFYLVGYVTTKAVMSIGKVTRGRRGFMLILMIGLPTGLEGTLPGVEWNREESVTRSRIVLATPAQVRAALAARPNFAMPLPLFLRLGFPVPVTTAGSGLLAGDERTIVLEHAHGGHLEHGTLSFRIADADSQSVRFEPVSDDSYITHWLAWRSSEVRWRPISATATEVQWTLRYRRRLDPAWYFAPLERYGVGVAAGYLIDALATPGVAKSAMPVAMPLRAVGHHGS